MGKDFQKSKLPNVLQFIRVRAAHRLHVLEEMQIRIFKFCNYYSIFQVGYMNTSKDARKGFSAGQWPVDGGCDGSETCSYSELVITGHADGSIR